VTITIHLYVAVIAHLIGWVLMLDVPEEGAP
jgi:hypothetical protein